MFRKIVICIAAILCPLGAALAVTNPWDIPVGFISTGARVSAPQGFLDFCRRYPEDCARPAVPAGPVQMTTRRMLELNTVNADVNDTLFFNSDDKIDIWDYPQDNIGDCEDYVIEKRRRLLDIGWPEDALLITLVRLRTPDFAGRTAHAVLTARTANGDYVLSSDIRSAVPWTTAQKLFDYVMIQTPDDPQLWAMVTAPAVASPAGMP